MDLNLQPAETLDTLSYNNSFHLVGQGTPNLRTLEPGQKRSLARLLCGAGRGEGIIYTRHLYYTNFTQHGCNVSYFNMVSDFQTLLAGLVMVNTKSCILARSVRAAAISTCHLACGMTLLQARLPG